MLKKWLKGARSILKTSVGIDRVSLWEYQRRLNDCSLCDSVDDHRSTNPICTECSCMILFKARDAEEECPLDKW